MPSFTDQVGNVVQLPETPKRIISLVPSQTELLHYFGLNDEVIGITKFCIHPSEWFKTKTRIGGTKTVDIEAINKLAPDLIIANKEENTKDQIEALQAFAPVWVSDIKNLQDALEMIDEVGKITNNHSKAACLRLEIERGFDDLTLYKNQFPMLNPRVQGRNLSTPSAHQLSCAYLIWRDPYMAAGGDTFINDMLMHCGLKNVFEDHLRYPEISINQLSEANCQLLLLSSEPYPFKQKHVDELQRLLPSTNIVMVDGEMFSWYGSRLLSAIPYFKTFVQSIATAHHNSFNSPSDNLPT